MRYGDDDDDGFSRAERREDIGLGKSRSKSVSIVRGDNVGGRELLNRSLLDVNDPGDSVRGEDVMYVPYLLVYEGERPVRRDECSERDE